MITSTSNTQIKNLMQLIKKAKVRNEQRLFVVEGIKMFEELPRDWIRQVYVSESFEAERKQETLLKGVAYEVLSDSVFKSVSDTQTPQGILCAAKMPRYELADVLCGADTHLLVLESIQDPGNLGTMFRTGEGAGISGVIMNRTTVDVFNPKTIRATMGSIYRVPFYVADDFKETLEVLRQHQVTLYAAHLAGKMSYEEMDYKKSCGFLIGNEGNGLTAETADRADCYVRIPMEGKVESLNAAIAATLLMYEAARQRRK